MNIVIAGIGRAGSTMAKYLLNSCNDNLLFSLCRNDSKKRGLDLGEVLYNNENIKLNIPIISISDFYSKEIDEKIDVLIDFSHKSMTGEILEFCLTNRSSLVLCTTKHTNEEIEHIKNFTINNNLGVVYAPNLTLGINLLMSLCRTVSQSMLNFDYEIVEKHPQDKPIATTTATLIANSIGHANIPIHSIRLNGYIGVHEVICTDGIERITITHESLDRTAFARGAMTAAKFIRQNTGFYLMNSVVRSLLEPSL